MPFREKNAAGRRVLPPSNLSYPYNLDSVNLNKTERLMKIRYASLQDAINLLNTSPAPFIAKSDISQVFLLSPVSPFRLPHHWILPGRKIMTRASLREQAQALSLKNFLATLLFIVLDSCSSSNMGKVLKDFCFVEEF